MKGGIWRSQRKAVLYSATEKGDSRRGTSPADDKVTAPDRVGHSLIPLSTFLLSLGEGGGEEGGGGGGEGGGGGGELSQRRVAEKKKSASGHPINRA